MKPPFSIRYSCSRSPSVASPKVPSSTAMIVMPICTVASSRDGSAFNSSAASAPALPLAASGFSRAGRADTSAISAIAKKPLTRISSRTIDSCRVSIGSPA